MDQDPRPRLASIDSGSMIGVAGWSASANSGNSLLSGASNEWDSVHVLIRRELSTDFEVIRSVHTAAFDNPKLAGAAPVEVGLVDALRAGGHLLNALSLVALKDGVVVGHVACSRATVGPDAIPLIGLGPIGVPPRWQRQGVGRALMHATLAAADALDERAVVLVGHTNYYPQFGFEPAERHGLRPPVDSWGPHFQIRRLTAWDPAIAGVFRFAPPFEEL